MESTARVSFYHLLTVVIPYALLLLSSTMIGSVSGDPEACMFNPKCQCERNNSFYVVSCIGVGIDPVKDCPADTTHLFVQNNPGGMELKENSIGDLPKLQTLNLSNNSIVTVTGKTFVKNNLPMLEELILDNNNLNFTSITIFNTLENLASLSLKNALYSPEAVNSLRHSLVKSNLPKLKYLWLDSNQLVLLPVRLFYVNKGAVNSQRLEVISLKNNSIGTIEYGTFNSSVLKHLKTIDLRDNGLYTLDKTVLSEFDKFPNLTIKLFPNTFRCNCDLRYFHAWMQSTNVTLPGKEKLVCAEGYYPYENANQNIMSLDAADFKCQHAIAVEHYLEPSYVILGIILSFLIACILGVVFLRRKQIKVGLRNVFLAARESIESGPYGERRGYVDISKNGRESPDPDPPAVHL